MKKYTLQVHPHTTYLSALTVDLLTEVKNGAFLFPLCTYQNFTCEVGVFSFLVWTNSEHSVHFQDATEYWITEFPK
jgi:hypothetical protein